MADAHSVKPMRLLRQQKISLVALRNTIAAWIGRRGDFLR
jgi:hypothetical protein